MAETELQTVYCIDVCINSYFQDIAMSMTKALISKLKAIHDINRLDLCWIQHGKILLFFIKIDILSKNKCNPIMYSLLVSSII